MARCNLTALLCATLCIVLAGCVPSQDPPAPAPVKQPPRATAPARQPGQGGPFGPVALERRIATLEKQVETLNKQMKELHGSSGKKAEQASAKIELKMVTLK